MNDLQPIDIFFVKWFKANQDRMIPISDGSRWTIQEYVEFAGWPSEEEPEKHFEELQHILNDSEYDLGIPLPPEIIAYRLSKWAGNQVPVTHPLVVNNKKWLEVYYATEYDAAKPADHKQLFILIYQIAGPELKENLGEFSELSEYIDSPSIEDQSDIHLFVINDELYYIATSESMVAIMDGRGNLKIFDYNGTRLYQEIDTLKIKNYIIGGMRHYTEVTDTNELASIVGNRLADLILGNDGLSIMDLP
jgi:hypothetical protein